jgi:ribose transport system substrate-binding protein
MFRAPVFEDSVTGKPNPVECRPDLPGNIYISAQMAADAQAKVINQ